MSIGNQSISTLGLNDVSGVTVEGDGQLVMLPNLIFKENIRDHVYQDRAAAASMDSLQADLDPNYIAHALRKFVSLLDTTMRASIVSHEGGATMVLSMTCPRYVVFCSMGDSSAYLHVDGKLEHVVQPHVPGFDPLYSKGILVEYLDGQEDAVSALISKYTDKLKCTFLQREACIIDFVDASLKDGEKYEILKKLREEFNSEAFVPAPTLRVRTGLMCSRSLGDFSQDKCLVRQPEIAVIPVEAGKSIEVLLCSDGVTDVLPLSEIDSIICSKDPDRLFDLAETAFHAWKKKYRESDDIILLKRSHDSEDSKFKLSAVFDGHGKYGHVYAQFCQLAFEYIFAAAFPILLAVINPSLVTVPIAELMSRYAQSIKDLNDVMFCGLDKLSSQVLYSAMRQLVFDVNRLPEMVAAQKTLLIERLNACILGLGRNIKPGQDDEISLMKKKEKTVLERMIKRIQENDKTPTKLINDLFSDYSKVHAARARPLTEFEKCFLDAYRFLYRETSVASASAHPKAETLFSQLPVDRSEAACSEFK